MVIPQLVLSPIGILEVCRPSMSKSDARAA
jgi:hypothetical protein